MAAHHASMSDMPGVWRLQNEVLRLPSVKGNDMAQKPLSKSFKYLLS